MAVQDVMLHRSTEVWDSRFQRISRHTMGATHAIHLRVNLLLDARSHHAESATIKNPIARRLPTLAVFVSLSVIMIMEARSDWPVQIVTTGPRERRKRES